MIDLCILCCRPVEILEPPGFKKKACLPRRGPGTGWLRMSEMGSIGDGQCLYPTLSFFSEGLSFMYVYCICLPVRTHALPTWTLRTCWSFKFINLSTFETQATDCETSLRWRLVWVVGRVCDFEDLPESFILKNIQCYNNIAFTFWSFWIHFVATYTLTP